MAPAQTLDINTQNTDKYTHKKFQGKRNYAHKKFGTRSGKLLNSSDSPKEAVTTNEVSQNTNSTLATKRNTNDLFRPYALPDNTPSRKRKYSEVQTDLEEKEENPMEFKRFASCAIPPTPSPSPPIAYGSYNPHFIQPSPIFFNPNYRQHYQFNPQTFALILQKQRAALCMGEILKRQANLNLYNLMGQ
ncbi:uncharacterized protein LOC111682478 [Lucilia cuprina]|uniref:uncharacterized protein LOC111682478 n=1 Tax=Lucilia cuprina TaxID=7375 RepID=UPI000C71A015|nr:uncharacterized protein LOC111682478 [Lucilia cuprina]XP_046809783.1 uncharacterized protein LOC111682478 [Lucilia cuprina]XP_046809785.1 uncharacterized protein LOC111682478 [Lucilia cuprina]